MLTITKKSKIIKEHQAHEKDTGSAAVQIAILSEQIKELTDHLKKHKKDNHSRRGLLQMVARRRKLLGFLKAEDEKQFKTLSKKLDL